MAEKTKNLCAQIPETLHDQVRKHQAESGKNLSEYMTSLITKFYEQEENTTMSNKRTIAFTVPEDIFLDFKEYLDRNNLTGVVSRTLCAYRFDTESRSGISFQYRCRKHPQIRCGIYQNRLQRCIGL